MIKAIVSDFSRVIFHYKKDPSYVGSLNAMHDTLKNEVRDYKVLDHFDIDQRVLNHYKSLRNAVTVHLFTQGHVHNEPEVLPKLKPYFDSILSAEDYNLKKNNPQSYLFISKKLHLDPADILFIDDQGPYLEAAKKAGFQTLQFTDTTKTFKQVYKLLNFT